MRLVDFARAMVCQATVTVGSAVSTPPAERLLLQQWKRVGNNLNQVARQLNALGRPAPENLEAALADIRHLIQRADGNGPKA